MAFAANQYVETGEVRVVFAHLTKPETKTNDRGEYEQYSACLLIPKDTKGGKKTLAALEAAYNAAVMEGKARLGSSYKPGAFAERVSDGDAKDDETLEKHPYFKGCRILNAHSKFAPVLQLPNSAVTNSEDEIYNGMYARVKLIAAPFMTGNNMNRGVTWYLQVVQKTRDAERLGGGDPGFPPLDEAADGEDGEDGGVPWTTSR
jgi:hypothetical protein